MPAEGAAGEEVAGHKWKSGFSGIWSGGMRYLVSTECSVLPVSILQFPIYPFF